MAYQISYGQDAVEKKKSGSFACRDLTEEDTCAFVRLVSVCCLRRLDGAEH